MAPRSGGGDGSVIVIFRGKVWGGLDLTLKNRFLETGFRAAGEYSANRTDQRGACIKQEMTSDSPLSSDRQRTSDQQGTLGKIVHRLYF